MTVYTAKVHLEPTPTTTTIRHGVTYTYPEWAYIIGWFVAGGPIFLGLLYGVVHACALTRGRKDVSISHIRRGFHIVNCVPSCKN